MICPSIEISIPEGVSARLALEWAVARRRIMLIAWDFFREDRHEGFSRALKRAWAYVRRVCKKPDRITRLVASGATHIQLTNLTRRADRRHLGKDAARRQAQFGA